MGGCSSKPSNSLNDQDFRQLKKQCKKNNNNLFVDDKFPANYKSLSYRHKNQDIRWLRPKEICDDPKFILEGSSRHDINQGEIGNCWILASMSNLADNRKYFNKVVPKDQDFDSKNYVGIFRFRFWSTQSQNPGEWIEVVIDDRLPTKNSKLIYARSNFEAGSDDPNKQKHEFWPALLEKAYAKLHGSYNNLESGDMNEAAVNFTGGIPEWIDLHNNDYLHDQAEQNHLFDMLLKARDREAFMGCGLKKKMFGNNNLQGLKSNHAYTITNLVQVRSWSRSIFTKHRLVRLRDPWGKKDNEWTGTWSRNSKKWSKVSTRWHRKLGKVTENGEFYMTFEDFVNFFGKLNICHLNPGSFDGSGKKHFSKILFNGEWKGKSAGGYPSGSKIDLKYFNQNPKFYIDLRSPTFSSKSAQCSVVISLMQCFGNRQHAKVNQTLLGFKIFKCGDISKNQKNEWMRLEDVIYYHEKEVTKKAQLLAGKYCIIPHTQKRHDHGEFLLRIFAEKSWGLSEITDHEESSETEMMSGIQYIPVRVSGAGLTKAIPEVRNTFTLETHIRSGVRFGLNSHGFGFEEENVGDDVHYIPNAGAEGTLTISVTFENENILGSPFQVNIP